MSEPPKRKRRWFQFSLRTLLIVVTLMAVPCAWIGRSIEQKRREREAVSAIKAVGGGMGYDHKPSGPIWLRYLLGDDFFSEVAEIELSRTAASDIVLMKLKSCAQTKELALDRTQITDDGLVAVKELCQLQYLSLRGTAITDRGLSNLSGLTHLNTLILSGTRITDAGVGNLSRNIAGLRQLFLNGTGVTDGVLQYLKSFTKLTMLQLSYTNVTDTGAAELQKSLPYCEILHAHRVLNQPATLEAVGGH